MIKFIFRICGYVLSIALFILTIVSAYCGKVSPLLNPVPSVLALAFPYLGALTIVTVAIWILCRRWIFGALGIGVIALCWGTFRMALIPMGHTHSPKPDQKELSILTYNILNGTDIRDDGGPDDRSLNYMLQMNPDIICLQEASKYPENPQLQEKYPYIVASPLGDLALFSKYPARLRVEKTSKDYLGSSALYEVIIDTMTLNILNVHMVPCGLSSKEREVISKMKQLSNIRESLTELSTTVVDKLEESFRHRAMNAIDLHSLSEHVTGSMVICGDFNDAPGSWAYRTICSDGFADAYNATNFISMPTYNLHAFYFRIDQMLYRTNQGMNPISVTRGDIDSSDHYPLFARFALN